MDGKQQPSSQPERPADPPWWIADTDLFLGEPGASGTLPVRAHAAGDQVPHEHVIRYGWQDRVHVPGQWAAPPESPSSSSRAPAPPAPAAKAASSGGEEQ